MTPTFQAVGIPQSGELLTLMREFYQQSGMPWSEPVAQSSLQELLRSPEKGGAWLVRIDGAAVGYVVLTLAFSLEFGGVFAFLDELFVAPGFRRRGIAEAALRFVEEQCRELGAATLRLETWTGNESAIRLYERQGLLREERYLMTKRLS